MELSTFIGGSDGYYKKGVRVTNFTLALEAIKHNEQGGMIGCQIRVQAEGKDEIEVELSVRQVNKGKWLADVPTAVWCSEEKEFYMQFRKQLAALEKDFPQVQTVVPTTGFRKVDGEWLFAFSNGALSARGFNNDICSAVKGYNFNRKEKLFEDEMERFLNLMLTKMEVLYPVFAINLLSVIRDPFADAGIDLALTLFLEGRSGAGKTTLAQVIGMFTDAETESYAGNYHKRRLVSSTEKAACVVKSLTESRGITFILDDVKREKVERQRGKSRAASDIVLRSVYQGNTTEQSSSSSLQSPVETSAIITGEFRETSDSQNARMAILDIAEFMQEEENRLVLTEFQRNPMLLQGVMGEFIRWLAYKLSMPVAMAQFCELMRETRRMEWPYENYANGSRLKDSRERLLFASKLFGQFLAEQFPGLDGQSRLFVKAALQSVDKLMRNTFENLGGIAAVAVCIMKEFADRILVEERIRKASYVRAGLPNWSEQPWSEEQFCFCWKKEAKPEKQLLYVPAVKKSFQKSRDDWEAADETDQLLMRRADFEEMLQKMILKCVTEGKLAEEDGRKINLPLLAKLGVLLVWPRTDGIARYSAKYPVIWLEEEAVTDDYYKYTKVYGDVDYEETVAFNMDHEIFKALRGTSSYTTEPLPSVIEYKYEEIRKVRKSFHSASFRIKTRK